MYNKRQRLEESLKATTDLGVLSKERNKILENYYEKRLKILQQKLMLKEKSVIAKEKIAKSLCDLLENHLTK